MGTIGSIAPSVAGRAGTKECHFETVTSFITENTGKFSAENEKRWCFKFIYGFAAIFPEYSI